MAGGRRAVLRSVQPPAAGKARRAAGTAAGLPWTRLPATGTTPIDDVAGRFARSVLRQAPAWLTQVGAFTGHGAHPSGAAVSVAYLAVLPTGTEAPGGAKWVAADSHAGLTPRQRAMLDAAVGTLRERMDIAPVAFRMLPREFTLAELQAVYELLLGRRVHKASFRRALQGTDLVAPTDEWRSEGRGRPAQLFRYAPPRRRRAGSTSRRPVRFDLLG